MVKLLNIIKIKSKLNVNLVEYENIEIFAINYKRILLSENQSI